MKIDNNLALFTLFLSCCNAGSFAITWTDSSTSSYDDYQAYDSDQIYKRLCSKYKVGSAWYRLFCEQDSGNNYKQRTTTLDIKDYPAFNWGNINKPITPIYNWWQKSTTTEKSSWPSNWQSESIPTFPSIDIPDIEIPTVNIDWHESYNGQSQNDGNFFHSTFSLTGVVIGIGALLILALILLLGLVYCCRSNRQRMLRRNRLFLITARPDDEDYEQFRNEAETTPPCVGMRVECPPSYEDALYHSTAPPEITSADAAHVLFSPLNPPSYCSVIDDYEECNLEPTTTGAEVGNTIPTGNADLEAIEIEEESSSQSSDTSSSQLVLHMNLPENK